VRTILPSRRVNTSTHGLPSLRPVDVTSQDAAPMTTTLSPSAMNARGHAFSRAVDVYSQPGARAR